MIYLQSHEIGLIIDRLAEDITKDYRYLTPVIVCVLSGAFIFTADLVRKLNFPLEVDFIKVSSYKSTRSTGKVKMTLDVKTKIYGRNVIILEDIIDTGLTTSYILEHIRRRFPASLALCALLDKAEKRIHPVKINYLGLDAPDRFIIGYGMDRNGICRNLPDIWC